MSRLIDKTALVTGGSRGIGRAIAMRLAADGAFVVVHYATNVEAADETVRSIEETGGTSVAIRAEFGVDGDLDTLFAHLHEALGTRQLDILVNNVGVGGQSGSIEDVTGEHFDRLFAVNVKAPLLIIQRALPLIPAGGRIINVSSADTRIALPDELTYSMTKGAINILSQTLAEALGVRQITVNAVAPGITDTGKLTALAAQPMLMAGTEALTALGRVGQPADIADVVAFLASDDARWVTGQVIDVSGGSLLGPGGLRRMMTAAST